jgi:hypothetical protein
MDGITLAWALLGSAGLLLTLAIGAAAGGPGRHRRRRASARPPSAPELLAAALQRIRVRTFDRMAPGDRASVLGLLEQAAAAATFPEHRARANLMLAEMEMIGGRPDRALERYRAALRWSPTVPVTRTIELLERRLSPSIPVSARLAP